jgi:hypothetical protein
MGEMNREISRDEGAIPVGREIEGIEVERD